MYGQKKESKKEVFQQFLNWHISIRSYTFMKW